jgi:hypothetical protein
MTVAAAEAAKHTKCAQLPDVGGHSWQQLQQRQ